MHLIHFAQQAGLNPKLVAGTHGGEYKSACPRCGGDDRFYIQPNKKQKNCNGYYCCRQCEISGDTIQFCIDILGMKFPEAAEAAQATIAKKPFSRFLPKAKVSHYTVPEKQPELWTTQATAIVTKAHEMLLQQPEIIAYLTSRGLPVEAIKKYKFGWLPTDIWFDGSEWGSKKDKIWFPKGILIPVFSKNTIIRLKVSRSDWHSEDDLPKFIVISGSKHGLNIVGTTKHPVMIVFESELDAYAIHHIASDFAFAIATGGNLKEPDILVEHLAQHRIHLFICHDNDDAGNIMLCKWQRLYPHAKALPTPQGKDIGEAIQQGVNIRSWLIDALPTQLQENLGFIKKPLWRENQPYIDQFLQYVSERTITRQCYVPFEERIALGPNGPKAEDLIIFIKMSLNLIAKAQHE